MSRIDRVEIHGFAYEVPNLGLPAHGAQGDIRMAGASEAVLNVVATMIDGDPLDAEAEAAARDANWRE